MPTHQGPLTGDAALSQHGNSQLTPLLTSASNGASEWVKVAGGRFCRVKRFDRASTFQRFACWLRQVTLRLRRLAADLKALLLSTGRLRSMAIRLPYDDEVREVRSLL
jgi:hypothetical protein